MTITKQKLRKSRTVLSLAAIAFGTLNINESHGFDGPEIPVENTEGLSFHELQIKYSPATSPEDQRSTEFTMIYKDEQYPKNTKLKNIDLFKFPNGRLHVRCEDPYQELFGPLVGLWEGTHTLRKKCIDLTEVRTEMGNLKSWEGHDAHMTQECLEALADHFLIPGAAQPGFIRALAREQEQSLREENTNEIMPTSIIMKLQEEPHINIYYDGAAAVNLSSTEYGETKIEPYGRNAYLLYPLFNRLMGPAICPNQYKTLSVDRNGFMNVTFPYLRSDTDPNCWADIRRALNVHHSLFSVPQVAYLTE